MRVGGNREECGTHRLAGLLLEATQVPRALVLRRLLCEQSKRRKDGDLWDTNPRAGALALLLLCLQLALQIGEVGQRIRVVHCGMSAAVCVCVVYPLAWCRWRGWAGAGRGPW